MQTLIKIPVQRLKHWTEVAFFANSFWVYYPDKRLYRIEIDDQICLAYKTEEEFAEWKGSISSQVQILSVVSLKNVFSRKHNRRIWVHSDPIVYNEVCDG